MIHGIEPSETPLFPHIDIHRNQRTLYIIIGISRGGIFTGTTEFADSIGIKMWKPGFIFGIPMSAHESLVMVDTTIQALVIPTNPGRPV